MPRIARVVGVGLPHHVTQRGNNRERVFFDDDDRRFYLWTLAQYRQQYGVNIWAYCLMDNHVHFLAVPEREESLARCFAGTNLMYTQHVNKKQGRSGRLWQNRFFSCPVDRDEYLLPVLRYIETNPVRAGMAKQAWDYEWSSARLHVLGTPDAVVAETIEVVREMDREYRRFLHQTDHQEQEKIRLATATGRPLGGESFLVKLESKLRRSLSPQRAGRPRKQQ
jgi:putative transposase